MATVTVQTLGQSKSLDPGQDGHWWWNNANYEKLFALDVVPLDAGSTQTRSNHTYELEITRQWRKFITKEKPGSIGVTVNAELEIHYVVKNIGTTKAQFDVKLAVIN